LLLNSIFNITGKLNRNTGENNPSAKSPALKSVLPLALAVGMVPCPGVVIIMLFALSFNLLTIGLAMSLLMALGMATTITLAGLVSILGRKGLLKGLARKERAQNLIQKGLSVFGSLLIVSLGSILLVGLL
jgi:ABC-type nickel/cobalt efflux system permease component RcnA